MTKSSSNYLFKIFSLFLCFLIHTLHASDADDYVPGEFSGYVGFTTDYRFRGITQSDEEPAVQGNMEWSHECGFHLGIFGSNVDFNDGDSAHVEIDYYGGYTHSWDCVDIGLGVNYYSYPGASSSLDYDFVELIASLAYCHNEWITASGSVNYSPEFFGASGHAVYPKVAVQVPIYWRFVIDGHVGYQLIDDNASYGVPDYLDWRVALGFDIHGFTLTLEYTDTDISKADCPDGCGSAIIFSISRTL